MTLDYGEAVAADAAARSATSGRNRDITTSCAVIGSGPAGLMLARAGVGRLIGLGFRPEHVRFDTQR